MDDYLSSLNGIKGSEKSDKSLDILNLDLINNKK